MMNRHDVLKSELSKRNQFKDNFLTQEIIEVIGCDKKRAMEIQDGLCNLLSFWALLFCQGLADISFKDFYKYLLDNKFADEEGWLKIEKPDLLSDMGINAQVIKYKTFPEDRQPGECYQVAVNGKHHFIAACVNDDMTISIYDTNKRGCPEDSKKALRKDKIDWVKFVG